MTLQELVESSMPIDKFVNHLVTARKNKQKIISAKDWEKIHDSSMKHAQFLFTIYQEKLKNLNKTLEKRKLSGEISEEQSERLKNSYFSVYRDKVSTLKKVNTFVINEFRNYLIANSKNPEYAKLVIVFLNKRNFFNKLLDKNTDYNFEKCLKDFHLIYTFSKNNFK